MKKALLVIGVVLMMAGCGQQESTNIATREQAKAELESLVESYRDYLTDRTLYRMRATSPECKRAYLTAMATDPLFWEKFQEADIASIENLGEWEDLLVKVAAGRQLTSSQYAVLMDSISTARDELEYFHKDWKERADSVFEDGCLQ